MESKVNNDELPEGMTVEDISDLPLVKEFLSYHPLRDAVIRIHPFNQMFPAKMKGYLKGVMDFEMRDDDVWVSSYPKAGTTWTTEMVWLIMNNADTKKANELNQHARVPWPEGSGVVPGDMFNSSVTMSTQAASPRTLKTHLSFDMLPKGFKDHKLIYVTRNPRDVCVSYHNHMKVLDGCTASFKEFAELFLNDVSLAYGPFMDHVLGYWNRRHQPNILFITYEEMKDDLMAVMRKVAKFLNKEISDEDLKICEDHLSFDKMKKNPAVNKEDGVKMAQQSLKQRGIEQNNSNRTFMNKGKKGGWKDLIDGDLLERFKEWEMKGLKDSDLTFRF